VLLSGSLIIWRRTDELCSKHAQNQLANNSRNKDFGSFDVNNITATQMNKLRNDIYGGYKTTTSDTYGRTGKDSYGRTGTKSSLDSNYYKTHAGWSGVAGKLGISNINSENDVRQMYDFVNGYTPPAPAAAPAPAPTPQQAALPVNNPYKAEADRLLKTIKEMEAAKPKAIYAASQAVQPTDLTIASAGTTSKQTGTSSFKRSKKKTVTGNNLRTIQSVNI
jgi:hypothetical protein